MQDPSQETHRSLRSSLMPFIRQKSDYQDQDQSTVIDPITHFPTKRYLMERYHDNSYIVKDPPPTKMQTLISAVIKMNKFVRCRWRNGDANKYRDGHRHWSRRKTIQEQEKLTINPDSNYLIFWNVFVAISILYNLFEIPIAIFFTSDVYKSEFETPAGLFFNCFFLVVLFINWFYVIPNTQFYRNGYLVSNHHDIVKKYIGYRFIFQIVPWTVLLAYIISNTYELIYLKLLFYFQIYRLMKIDYLFQKKIELTRMRLAFYKLIRLVMFILFIVLWISCGNFAIDYHYYTQGTDSQYYPVYLWLTNSASTKNTNLVEVYPWYVWLNYSTYWCLQTISMVGYGDQTPRNPPQVVYCNLVVLLLVLLYAFFVSGVWEIISQAAELSEFRRKQWKSFKQYELESIRPFEKLHKKSQQKAQFDQLKNKVGSYLFEMWQQEQQQLTGDNIVEILDTTLTAELKDDLFINYRQHLFQKICLFRELALNEGKYYQYVFRDLVFKIKQKRYGRTETLMSQGAIPDRISYLLKGTASLSYPNSNYVRQIKQSVASNFVELPLASNVQRDRVPAYEYYNYGVREFFIQQNSPYSAIAESFCKVSELSYTDFINSLKSIDEFYTKYCELRDQIKLYARNELTGELCFECESPDHNLLKCPQCDLILNHKKNLLFYLYTRITNNKTSKDKVPLRIPHNRKNYSQKLKIMGLTARKTPEIDRLKNYKSYYPKYNL